MNCLIRTEVVLKFLKDKTEILVEGFNKNRSCIEIQLIAQCLCIEKKFNKNRSCIEIFPNNPSHLYSACLIRTEVVLKFPNMNAKMDMKKFNKNRSCIEIRLDSEYC